MSLFGEIFGPDATDLARSVKGKLLIEVNCSPEERLDAFTRAALTGIMANGNYAQPALEAIK